MFVMINASDNPWMVVLLVFVQVIVPLLQSNAADEDGDGVITIALMFIFAISVIAFFKFYGIIRALFLLRGQASEDTTRPVVY
ncbi:hypothetical protein PINS_up003652 [Pythium insidiosum]|nr:hypothetical protein PINS_up003652 [Pythium insidiosum]